MAQTDSNNSRVTASGQPSRFPIELARATPERRVRSRILACLLGAASLLMVTNPSLGAQDTGAPGLTQDARGGKTTDSTAALADLPTDVDLVVIVNEGRAQRTSALGMKAQSWLENQGVLERLAPAGADLGKELGWTRDELFDRLLGRRAMLIFRSAQPGADPASASWALVSTISRDDERRLRERLAVAPRGMIEGRQVLSLERGRYELASRVPGGDPKTQADTAGVEIVLGPSDPALIRPGPTLFEELVRRAPATTAAGDQGRTQPFSRTRVFDRAAAFPSADVLVLWRFRHPLPGGSPSQSGAQTDTRATTGAPWDQFFLLAAWRESNTAPAVTATDAGDPARAEGSRPAADEETWSIRIAYADDQRVREIGQVQGFAIESFQELSSGACGAMLQAAALDDLLTPSLPVADIMRQLQMPDGAAALIGSEEALRLESIAAVGDRPARLAVGAAVGLTDVPAAAPQMDKALVSFIGTIERARGGGAGTDGGRGRAGEPSASTTGRAEQTAQTLNADFAGMAPAAVRVVPIVFNDPRPDVFLAGGALTMSWAFAEEDPLAASEQRSAARPGWWCVGLTPDASEAASRRPGDADAAGLVRRTLDPLRRARAAEHGWLWMVSLRPMELERALPAIWPDYRGMRSAMQGVSRVSARMRASELGEIEGWASFTLPAADGAR